MTTAYDYRKQEWMHGTEADRLLLEQTQDELDLLTSTDSTAYADFIGLPLADIPAYVTALRDRLAISVGALYTD